MCCHCLTLHYHRHHHHNCIRSNGNGNRGDVVPKLDVILMVCIEYHSHFDIIGRVHPPYIWQWLIIILDL